MIVLDQNALICDMAETYRIYDMRALPLHTVVVLASGLRANSRIRLKQGGLKASWETVLLAKIIDMLSAETVKPMTPLFLDEQKPKGKKADLMVFDSIEEFEAVRYGTQEDRNG